MDLIDRQAAIDEVHGAIYEFFDFCEDDEESPITHKDEQLLELNKAITIRIKQLPSARPKAKWVFDDDYGYYVCSQCGRLAEIDSVTGDWLLSNFCGECGAEMENE